MGLGIDVATYLAILKGYIATQAQLKPMEILLLSQDNVK